METNLMNQVDLQAAVYKPRGEPMPRVRSAYSPAENGALRPKVKPAAEVSFSYSSYRPVAPEISDGFTPSPQSSPQGEGKTACVPVTEKKMARQAVAEMTDNLVLIGELDLLANQMSVCYAEMSPMCRAVALEFGHGLAALRKKLNPDAGLVKL